MNGRINEGYILLFFELLFIGFAFQAVLIEDTTRFYVVIASMLLILVPLLVERKLVIRLPAGTKTMIAFALFPHVAGGINRWYWKFMPYYDKLAHVVSAFALGLVMFSLVSPPQLLGDPDRALAHLCLDLYSRCHFRWELGDR